MTRLNETTGLFLLGYSMHVVLLISTYRVTSVWGFFLINCMPLLFFLPTPYKGQINSCDFRADGQPCEFSYHSFLSYFCLLSHSLFSGSSFFLLFLFPFFPFFTSLSLVPAFFPPFFPVIIVPACVLTLHRCQTPAPMC